MIYLMQGVKIFISDLSILILEVFLIFEVVFIVKGIFINLSVALLSQAQNTKLDKWGDRTTSRSRYINQSEALEKIRKL